MKKFIAAACLVVGLATAPASAQDSGSTYDWESGSQYNWRTDSQGNTTVRGYNLNTGSTWNQTIRNNGNQSGYDSQGNSWNYNARTKTYNNFDTGKYCVNGICN